MSLNKEFLTFEIDEDNVNYKETCNNCSTFLVAHKSNNSLLKRSIIVFSERSFNVAIIQRIANVC